MEFGEDSVSKDVLQKRAEILAQRELVRRSKAAREFLEAQLLGKARQEDPGVGYKEVAIDKKLAKPTGPGSEGIESATLSVQTMVEGRASKGNRDTYAIGSPREQIAIALSFGETGQESTSFVIALSEPTNQDTGLSLVERNANGEYTYLDPASSQNVLGMIEEAFDRTF